MKYTLSFSEHFTSADSQNMNIYLSPHLSSVILFLNAADVVDEQHQDGVNRVRGM